MHCYLLSKTCVMRYFINRVKSEQIDSVMLGMPSIAPGIDRSDVDTGHHSWLFLSNVSPQHPRVHKSMDTYGVPLLS